MAFAVLLAFVGLACYPLMRIIWPLLTDGASVVAQASEIEGLWSLVSDTLLVVVTSSLIALFIGTALAWLNVRTDARLGILGDALPIIPFFLPSVASAVGWVMLLSPRGGILNSYLRDAAALVGIHLESGPINIFSWYALILMYAVHNAPLAYLLVSAGLRRMDASLEEQSRVCGAGLWRTFWAVSLPAIRPALAGAFLLTVWVSFGAYSIPAILTHGSGTIDMLSVRIVYLLKGSFPPQPLAALMLSAITVLFVGLAWYLQARIVRSTSFSQIGGKGIKSRAIELGAWRKPARAAMIAYVSVTTILPLVGLLIVALNGYWSPRVRWADLTLEAFRSGFADRTMRLALFNSVTLGVAAATLGIVIATVLSLLFVRSTTRGMRLGDGLIRLPGILPHVVLGLGFIYAFSGPPFRLAGTMLILLLAYMVVWMPQGLVATDSAVSRVGVELEEASRVSGAGEGRTVARIYAPLMTSGLAAAWLLLFVRTVGDLDISVLLAGPNTPVVGAQILSIYENNSYPDLCVLALILTGISVAAVAAVLMVGRAVAVDR